jgi:DNA-binding PadR family transcriptional regulator
MAANRQSRHLPAFILLTLADGPLHGHAIRAALTTRFPGYKADAGATYRTLQGLEKAKELSFRWDTDTRGPAKKVYTLTSLGWKRLEFWGSEIERRHAMLQIFLKHLKRSAGKKPTKRRERKGAPRGGRHGRPLSQA